MPQEPRRYSPNNPFLDDPGPDQERKYSPNNPFVEPDERSPYEEWLKSSTDYWRSVAQGLTLGFSDELRGVGAAIVPGGKSYKEARDAERDALADAHPVVRVAGEGAGAVATGLATAPALARRLGLGKAAALEGAAYGAGASEGSVTDRVPGAALGAAGAGAVGAGAAAVGAVARAAPKAADAVVSAAQRVAARPRESGIMGRVGKVAADAVTGKRGESLAALLGEGIALSSGLPVRNMGGYLTRALGRRGGRNIYRKAVGRIGRQGGQRADVKAAELLSAPPHDKWATPTMKPEVGRIIAGHRDEAANKIVTALRAQAPEGASAQQLADFVEGLDDEARRVVEREVGLEPRSDKTWKRVFAALREDG